MATEKHLDMMLWTGFATNKYPEEETPPQSKVSLTLSKERLKTIMKIIDTELTEKQADCVRAVFLQNMNLTKYAQLRGINKSSAHRRFHGGLKKLRKYGKYVKVLNVTDDD